MSPGTVICIVWIVCMVVIFTVLNIIGMVSALGVGIPLIISFIGSLFFTIVIVGTYDAISNLKYPHIQQSDAQRRARRLDWEALAEMDRQKSAELKAEAEQLRLLDQLANKK